MDELRASPDEPHHDDRPERRIPGAGGGDAESARQRIEPRSRTEYAADLEQRVVNGWMECPDTPIIYDSAADGSPGAEKLLGPLEILRRFEPRRAGLPETSARDAVAYVDEHCAERPWLTTARGCSPEVQRIFAALDKGGGHAHIRHEGWVTEEMNELRLRCLQDPAQLNVAKRMARIDGIKPGDQPHRCGSIATRIADPDAFAAAIARGVEHPDVQAALETEFKEKRAPHQVVLPIADLLGSGGHRFCTGWQLEAVDGSMKTARQRRDAWAEALTWNSIPDGPEPKARPVETFDGGTMIFTFGPNHARDGYEIVTMYVNPRESQ